MTVRRLLAPALLALAAAAVPLALAHASSDADAASAAAAAKLARGEYLVVTGGCHDCHTPLKLGPNGPEPDLSRMLAGHPQELEMPAPPALPAGPWQWVGAATLTAFAGPWGVSYARNLTPDVETGLGAWTEEQFVRAARTGRHQGVPGGRPILPPMPWRSLAAMTDEDLAAMWAYLQSIPALRNDAPQSVPALPPSPPAAAPAG